MFQEEDKAEGSVASRAAKCLTWWRVSGGELGALLAALRELDAPPDGSPAALQRAQLAQLSDRAADAELRCAALQADADLLRTLAGGERSDLHYDRSECFRYLFTRLFFFLI